MAFRQSNVCRMCLKDNTDNDFISMRENRDIKVKFFFCFSIPVPENPNEDFMICLTCVDQLNNYYQLKNHVQRTHNIYFGLQNQKTVAVQTANYQQQPTNLMNNSIDPIIKNYSNLTNNSPEMKSPSPVQARPRQLTVNQMNIAGALMRLKKNQSSVVMNRSRSILVHRANEDVSFKSPPNRDLLRTTLTFPSINSQLKVNDESGEPSTSRNAAASLNIKQEPSEIPKITEQASLPTFTQPGRRGKQRGEIGKHIFQDKETMRYPCVHCNKTFGSYQSVYIHLRNVHLKRASFICDSCEKGFYSKVALRNHMKNAHDQNKKFECDMCFKEFKCLAALTIHRSFRHHQRMNSI